MFTLHLNFRSFPYTMEETKSIFNEEVASVTSSQSEASIESSNSTYDFLASSYEKPPRPGAPTLLAIPPETLLHIISFLPSTASFLPLLQTSHTLRMFVTTHLPQICNTHILTYHARAASLLTTHLTNRWLLPTHSSIATTEIILSTEQIRLCKPIHPFAYLSTPGPLYLLFLEKHPWQIVHWHERAVQTYPEPDLTEDAFAATLGQHVVHPFLKLVHSTMNTAQDPVEDEIPRQRGAGGDSWIQHRMAGVRESKCLIKDKVTNAFKTCARKMSKNKKKTERKPLFGEVVNIDAEKKRYRSPEEELRRELLWYYGETGVQKCPLVDGERVGKRAVAKEVKDVKPCKKKRLTDFGNGVRRALKTAPRRALIPFRCIGGFESLE